jgi:DNA-binding MarR family transcriptional regulator
MAGAEQEPGSDGSFAQLIRLLKLGSFINAPMKDGVCDPSGVSQIELKVMMALSGEGELAGHDLVEIMGLPAMNVSRALAAMKERGWIEEVADPVNRRRRPVKLSESGLAAYQQIVPSIQAVAEALLGGLTARQHREFAAISEKIIAAMIEWIRGHHAEVKL